MKLLLPCFLMIMLIAGCRKPDVAKEISAQYTESMRVYHQQDILSAENSMKSFLGLLAEKQLIDSSAVNYNDLRGTIWLRLYSIYEFRGQKSEADDALNRVITFWKDRGLSKEALAKLVAEMEKEVPPNWHRSQSPK